jgi:hypothetical protein
MARGAQFTSGSGGRGVNERETGTVWNVMPRTHVRVHWEFAIVVVLSFVRRKK